MNDTELDTRLREWATWAVETAPDAVRPAPRRRRAWPAIAASVVVVLAVVAALLAARPSRHDTPPARPGTTGPMLRTAVPAPGMRAVTYHGLTIDVPRTWSQDTQPCGPTVSTVYLPQTAQPACARGTPPQGVTIVEFSSTTIPQAGSPTTVDGADAFRFSDPARHSVQVAVPSLRVSVEILTTSAALRRALIASLRIVDVDVYGCPTRHATTLSTGRPGRRSDAGDQLLPPGETDIHVCRYVGGLLERGALVGQPRDVAALSTVLNDLPAGSPVVYDLSSPVDDTAYVLRADYPSGPSVDVVVRTPTSGLGGASNGTRTARYQPRVLEVLSPLVG